MKKKFTILTASYNCARYLPDLVDSVIAQTYRPIEHIIVNDKSTDGTLGMIDDISIRYKKGDIEFKFIDAPKKLYCGSSYRLSLKNATGHYFGVLDSDDALEPFACEYVSSIYEKFPEIGWIYTQYNKYNRRMDRVIKKGWCAPPDKDKTLLDMAKKKVHRYSHWRTFSDRVPKRNTLFKKKLRCCVDKYLGYRLEELSPGLFVNKVCYKYRTRNRGEKPIVHNEPLRKVWSKVIQEVSDRRKKGNIKCYSIRKYK